MAPQFALDSPFLWFLLFGIYRVTASDFNPYVMNGGLLAAVAGRDFIVIATDTRLTGPTGYDILGRYHIASRIWGITSLNPMQASFSNGLANDSLNSIFAPDGSLNVQLWNELLKFSSNKSEKTKSFLRVVREWQHTQLPPVVVGSVGCQADCEYLKRSVRADARAAMYFDEVCSHNPMDAMAVALSQMLYSRRSLPFGSYCVLGGLSIANGGQVYVYDAIGSYEQVAISCTGTGFELLQPILDRKFAPFIGDDDPIKDSTRSGNLIQLPSTQVSCPTVEEAVCEVLAAYRSVAEREIGVGDQVVFYTVEKASNGRFLSKVWTASLKKH